jgi:hypothetical protein
LRKTEFLIVEFFLSGPGLFVYEVRPAVLRSATRAFSALRRTTRQSRAATSRGASWPIYM